MAESDRGRETFDISDISSDDGLHHSPPSSSPSTFTRFTSPLVNYIRNEWQSGAKYTQLPSAADQSDPPKWVQRILSIVRVPRFRRHAIVYLSLFIFCVLGWQYILSPRLEERSTILTSLDPRQEDIVEGWSGANALPQLEEVVQLRELNQTLLPAALVPEDGMSEGRRLIFIGDVHGCKSELENLLDKVSFNATHDHLVFTGDLIEKGPDSLGVVDLARKYNASCVRGNHEDRVLALRHDMLESNITDDSFDVAHPQNAKSRELAFQLSADQTEWLDACPVILNVGQITNMGQVVVVHGGLVPGVDLDRQDPYGVMNMRAVDLEMHLPSSERDKGVKWTKLFNKHQSLALQSENGIVTVVYGHDAKSGLSLKEYTKGLDSGCVKGGKLTALVVSDGGHQEIVQVKCSKHQKDKKLT